MVEIDNTGDEEDPETWEEAMDEMEDPWMREPSGRLSTMPSHYLQPTWC